MNASPPVMAICSVAKQLVRRLQRSAWHFPQTVVGLMQIVPRSEP